MFGDKCLLAEAADIDPDQRQRLLIPTLPLEAQGAGVRQPVDARQVDVRVLSEVDPVHGAPLRGH